MLLTRTTLVTLVLLAANAVAQNSGSITGTVRDATGAVVPGAQVVLSDSQKGISLKTTTNSGGDYLIAGLPTGTFNLTITSKGFQKYEATGIILQVAQKARVDAVLQLGAVTSEITVQGSQVAQVETQSSELSGVVTGKEISQIVLNGRNFTQLVTLLPGVSNQTGQDEGTVGVAGNVAMSINGGRTEYNNWEIDGGDNMDNGSNGTLNVYPNIDAIAEVKVLTSNYGAQYGRNGSGTIETVTKSGTKDVPWRSVRVPSQRRLQCSELLPTRRPGARVQEERLRIHDRRSRLHSQGLQPEQGQNVLLLVRGVAQGNCSRRDVQSAGSFRRGAPRKFLRCLSRGRIGGEQDRLSGLPRQSHHRLYFPNNTVPVNANAQDLLTLLPAAQPGQQLLQRLARSAHSLARGAVPRRRELQRKAAHVRALHA